MKISTIYKLGSATLILALSFWFVYSPENETLLKSKSKNSMQPKKGPLEVNGHRYDGPEKYAYYMSAVRAGQVDLNAPLRYPQYGPNYKFTELAQARQNAKSSLKAKSADATFTERGPANVPGRTRAILVDPDDSSQETWFAGNVSGGIWKTTNGGESWTEIAPDLANMAVVTLAMSEANTDVIYAGTGEGFIFAGTFILNGDGIVKSTDKGATWSVLPSTQNSDFTNVSRIIVDPTDENILLASTAGRKNVGSASVGAGAVMRSTDGGTSWTKVFEIDAPVQQIIAAPTDFQTQYIAVANDGVYRSDDAGLTWTKRTGAIQPSGVRGRIELGVSWSNPQKVFASVEGSRSTTTSDLYVTTNGGADWNLVEALFNSTPVAFLNEQGWYDNTVLVNPFDDDKVYVAGVGMYLIDVNLDESTTSSGYAIDFGEADFIDLVGFGANGAGGVLEVGSEANETTVEIRFGADKSQKAHRFLVPEGEGSGVPDTDFTYQDYVDVPFEVWDVDNNIQLMASFRDQQRNGTFELIENNTDGDPSTHSREYLYIHNVEYADTPDADIAVDGGGHIFNQMYFIWPFLTPGEEWTPDTFDDVSLTIVFETFDVLTSTLTTVSDGRGEYDEKNEFDFVFLSLGEVEGVHVDHHFMTPIITDESASEFKILNGNDGGVYITKASTDPGTVQDDWIWVSSGYNTMQFYGVDKSAGEDRFWGGAQDNGTWVTPVGETASSTTDYQFVIGGDGFEAISHYITPGKMIGGSQFNGFFGTDDNWNSNYNAQVGLGGNGPFVSKLSNAYQDPDVLYTIESDGVYKSSDFGRSWRLIPISEGLGFWSGVDVEVSKADPRIVWAGGGMTSTSSMHVSVDAGESFEAVPNFDDIGLATGIYSHPTLDSTAFVVFSVANSPKILRTDDLGQTWADISGFSVGSSSTGFPDVAVFAVQAMPYDENVIWAGTEIGIFETLDAGATWNLVDDFPSVTIWDFKIKDGMVVIATHGRGVWTADIPDLAAFTAPEVTLSPILVSAGGSFTELDINLSVNLRAAYDSAIITSNGETVIELEANAEPAVEELTFNVAMEGDYLVKGVAYKDGTPYFTAGANVTVSTPIVPIETYFNDFEEATMDDDFTLNGFTIERASGAFLTRALNSPHPYPEAGSGNQLNFTAQINTPVLIAAENANIRFDEIVLVEEGTAGTSFGDPEFWDFVIVEGSKDGNNWTPLLDGYDSDADEAWNGSSLTADAELYRPRVIDMTDAFEPGDVILIRFRLFSDEATNGWGWGIDNLEIQLEDADGDGFSVATDCDDTDSSINPGAEDILDNGIDEDCDGTELVTATEGELTQGLNVFPVPASQALTIEINSSFKGNVQVQVLDLNGKVMLADSFKMVSGEFSTRTLNTQTLSSGLYLLKISDEFSSLTRRIVID